MMAFDIDVQVVGKVRLSWTDESLRKRSLGYVEALRPLAVSGPRGVAFAVVGKDRMVLLDLVR